MSTPVYTAVEARASNHCSCVTVGGNDLTHYERGGNSTVLLTVVKMSNIMSP